MDESVAARWIRTARAEWRSLTGGPDTPDELRPTLVGVSGGADSAALAIALATLEGSRIVLAQVLHDQRPAELVHDDRRAVQGLAERLGIAVVVRHARSGAGNAEHEARKSRYAVLQRIAAQHGCRCVATAHHAYDQAETMLLAMTRGASPRALVGIRGKRMAEDGETLIIRPALSLPPAGAYSVCREYGYTPRVDATNRDPARARSRVRFDVVPLLDQCCDDLGGMLAKTAARLERGLQESAAKQTPDVGFKGIDPLAVHD